MASNGKLLDSELHSIPQGRLEKYAASAWNAPNGPADNGLFPTGPNSSYRTYETQVYYYQLYREGRGNLAAYPGTSNHGWGLAIDLAEPWMRHWIDDHGARFGWKKTEAPSEWWHVNYDGSVKFKEFKTLHHGSAGKRVLKYTKRLAYIHRPGKKAYLKRRFVTFRVKVVHAVREFQEDHGLQVDGEIGAETAAKIDAVFHKQYNNRDRKRRK